ARSRWTRWGSSRRRTRRGGAATGSAERIEGNDTDELHLETDGTRVRLPMTLWTRGSVRSVTCVLSLWTAMAHGACTDPSAAAAARAMAETQCPCATATSHREYVQCVAGVAKSAAASGSLSK